MAALCYAATIRITTVPYYPSSCFGHCTVVARKYAASLHHAETAVGLADEEEERDRGGGKSLSALSSSPIIQRSSTEYGALLLLLY